LIFSRSYYVHTQFFHQVEAQAMTTSKWEELGQNEDSNSQDTSMDSR